jgi:hypothetical protein
METDMSENEYNKRVQDQVQREIAEVESPGARYQTVLDRWFGEKRAIAEEEARIKKSLDPYNLKLYDPP